YANAGHPKPLHIRRSLGRAEPLVNASRKSQPALGLFEQAVYQGSEVNLVPGDLIMPFTDGLFEVQGSNEDTYTPQQLLDVVQKRVQQSASQLFDGLLEEIKGFSEAGFND